MSNKQNDIILESLQEDIEMFREDIIQAEERIADEQRWIDTRKARLQEAENRILEIQGLSREQDLIDLQAQEAKEKDENYAN